LDEFRDENGKLILSKDKREKLEAHGIITVEQLATTSLKEIMGLSGFGEKTARKVLESAQKALLSNFFMTAEEYYEKIYKNIDFLTTGSKKVDKLIGGGIQTRNVTEVWGERGIGKTQLCMQLSVNCQLPKDKGGLDGACLYVDSENNFIPQRVVQMARHVGVSDPLKNIILAPCFTSTHQRFILDVMPRKIEENNVRLIIVDSLIAHFRSEYVGRESLAERQQLLNQYIGKLRHYARTYNLAVVYTNQAIANPTAFGRDIKPAGGNITGHGGTPNLWIRRGKGSVRIIRLCKSPYLAEGEAIFKITDNGIEDVEE